MSTINSKSAIDAINAAAHAKTPRGQKAARLAAISEELDQIKGSMLMVTKALGSLRAAIMATSATPAQARVNTPLQRAEENLTPDQQKKPFYMRSDIHRKAWQKAHGRPAPSK